MVKMDKMKRKVLYAKDEADFLSEREAEWKLHDQQKIDVILNQIGNIDSFLEIGCGSGQILIYERQVTKIIEEPNS